GLDREGVLLIPILVDGATMPRSDQLPPSLAPLVRHQALELSPHRFRADTAQLLDVLERTLIDLRDEQSQETNPTETLVEEPPIEPEDDEPADTYVIAEPPAADPPRERPRRSSRLRLVLVLVCVVAVAVAAVVVGVLKAQSEDPKQPTVAPPPLGGVGGPIVLAHRGGDETYAWQTLPAFKDAARVGAAIETDVRWTKDGVAVLVHDAGTTPGMECAGGSHVVAETDWPVLRDDCLSAAAASSNGKRYGIPTFNDAVSAIAGIAGAEIYPEIKVPQNETQVRQFIGILTNVRMNDRAVITSSKPEELDKMHARAEKDGVNVRLMQFVSKKPIPVADLTQNLWGVAVETDIATESYVKELRAKGLKVMVWIVNTPAQWEAANRLKADIIMTDKPATYGEWVSKR
ncbi:MAG: glycerophosphodiester phosphodiesterase, partial [Aeromicrobium sp.]